MSSNDSLRKRVHNATKPDPSGIISAMRHGPRAMRVAAGQETVKAAIHWTTGPREVPSFDGWSGGEPTGEDTATVQRELMGSSMTVPVIHDVDFSKFHEAQRQQLHTAYLEKIHRDVVNTAPTSVLSHAIRKAYGW